MPKKRQKTNSIFEGIDFSEFTTPYKEVKQEQQELEQSKPKVTDKCFLITYKNVPDIAYVAFAKNRDKAKGKAYRFFSDSWHPMFSTKGNTQMIQGITKRIPELDKYVEDKKVPIPELMKYANFSFPCSACGNDNFKYKDYEIGRCFVVEGDGDLNEFIKGYVLCYNCFKKYSNK